MNEEKLVQEIGNEVCEGCGPNADCGEDPNDCFRISTSIGLLDDYASVASEFKLLLQIIKPLDECMCDFPCSRDGDDDCEGEYDFNNPSDHYQYCPRYFVEYVRAMAEGKPVPE